MCSFQYIQPLGNGKCWKTVVRSDLSMENCQGKDVNKKISMVCVAGPKVIMFIVQVCACCHVSVVACLHVCMHVCAVLSDEWQLINNLIVQ